MMAMIEGEFLEGYHLEVIPQFDNSNNFDMNALSAIAGMRAVWLLYVMGMWDHLEDLGVDRTEVEPVLKQCCAHYGQRLTVRQAQQLKKKVPALSEASTELRLAYALKHLDKKSKDLEGKKKVNNPNTNTGMSIYHAEVDDVDRAKQIAQSHTPEIEAAGGTVEVGGGTRDKAGIIMVKLPSHLVVDPANLFAGEGLNFSKVRAQVVAVPQDQGPDPRPRKESKDQKGARNG